MDHTFYIFSLIIACLGVSYAGEMTFELPDNEKQCFFEEIDKDVECTLEFQVYISFCLFLPIFKYDFTDILVGYRLKFALVDI